MSFLTFLAHLKVLLKQEDLDTLIYKESDEMQCFAYVDGHRFFIFDSIEEIFS